MTDYYTKVFVDIKSNPEINQWVANATQMINEMEDLTAEKAVGWCKERNLDLMSDVQLSALLDAADGCGYGVPIIPEHTVFMDGEAIRFESSEGHIEELAVFLQILIQRFDLLPLGFEYALTASKARPDSFGGGAVWITKDKIESFSSHEWLQQRLKSNQ